MRKPKTYFWTLSNYIDLSSYILNYVVIIYRTLGSENYEYLGYDINMSTLRIIGAIAGLLLWL